MIVKVCGMKYPENIRQVEDSGIDWMGFIFASQSPRKLTSAPSYLPLKVKRVGVFVNAFRTEIQQKLEEFSLDMIQLHGEESPQECAFWHHKGIPVIKAFAVESAETFQKTKDYEGKVSYFLFDTPCASYGGSGKTYDWSILSHYQGNTPFLLSGGIRSVHKRQLQELKHRQCVGIDLNSGFEVETALKNSEEIKLFVKQLKTKYDEPHTTTL